MIPSFWPVLLIKKKKNNNENLELSSFLPAGIVTNHNS